ncbi:MAG: hypothetical protein WAW84_06325 [Candidatus Rickettsiella isopodorum]
MAISILNHTAPSGQLTSLLTALLFYQPHLARATKVASGITFVRLRQT